MALEFAQKVRRIPVYPAADGYASEGPVAKMASNESPYPPITAATRLVVVCNPNNPTSTALALDEIAAFVADVPRHVAVILDEAYVEFSLLQDPEESVALLERHPNLVLLRTFSKVYGLCGLRV